MYFDSPDLEAELISSVTHTNPEYFDVSVYTSADTMTQGWEKLYITVTMRKTPIDDGIKDRVTVSLTLAPVGRS